jgi:hypothetical protein
MNVGLNVSNPGDTANVGFYVWVDLPSGKKYWVTRMPSVNLKSGLSYSHSTWKKFTLKSSPAGAYAWHAMIYDHANSEISWSISPWTFS